MDALFRAWSVLDNMYGRDGVTLKWFRADRNQPLRPFHELIADYDGLVDHYRERYPGASFEFATSLRRFDEQYVCELLSDEEMEALRAFVREMFGCEIHVKMVPVPVPWKDLSYPLSEVPSSPGQGRYQLWRELKYRLPFRIEGFFDLRGCASSIKLDSESKERGVVFLQQALDCLGLGSPVGRERLEAVVDSLYDRSGLFVEQGKTREERIREHEETDAIRRRAEGDGWVAWSREVTSVLS